MGNFWDSFWKWLSLGFVVVLVGVVLKDGSQASNLLSTFGSSYSNVLGTLEKAG